MIERYEYELQEALRERYEQRLDLQARFGEPAQYYLEEEEDDGGSDTRKNEDA